MHKLRTIVLEDEDEERQSLIKKLKFFTELDIVGEATTLDDSFHLIVEKQPDAAFIDIKLIGGDVFTLFRRLQEHGVHIPYSVVTTGYPQYAQSTLNDHRLFVVQFLAKPFLDDWQSKLRKSVDALMAARMAGSPTIAGSNTAGVPKYIFVNDQGTLLRLDFNKIAYLEVAGSGQTLVVTDTNVHRLDLTLTKFSELLPAEDFQRISRNNVINVARILRVNREVRKVDIEKGSKIKTLDIGPEFYTEFLKSLPMARTPAGKSVVIAKQPGSDNASQTSNMPMKGEESGRWQPEMQKNEKLYHLLPPEESVKSNLTTVLFCHLQDSSRFHQNTVSDNVFRYIEYCFQHFDEIVIKYSLEKIKTFGISLIYCFTL